ncbi:MAG: hypothetical protein OXFUSZZB_002161 [Candidatus Fervidibacter sp.]|jgi:crossover junction endodeoxyribonuclease RusA
MRWRFILPLPPSINHQYTERDGRWVLSREARHYKEHLAKAFRRLKAAGKLRPQETDEPAANLPLRLFDEPEPSDPLRPSPPLFLRLRLEFFFKTAQRRDLDNGLKIVQDAICQALGVDDRQVVAVELVKRVDAQNPRLEVTVTALSDWDFSPSEPIAMALDLRPFVPPIKSLHRSARRRPFNLADWLAQREEASEGD